MNTNTVDLNKLRAFLAVAERGGVSAAAGELALTRSAVSQSVSSLEGSLGVRLFDRVGRRLVLTNEGRTLARRFARVNAELVGALEWVVNEEREVRGLVRLGLFIGAARARVAGCLARFTTAHPRVRVKLLYGAHAELREQLAANRLDFALALVPGRAVEPRVRSSRLFRQELVLVSARPWPRARLGPDALEGVPFVDYYQASPLVRRWLRHHFPRQRIEPDVRVFAASTDMALELVLAGAGAAVLPRELAEPLARAKRLFPARTGRPELEDAVWLEEPAGAWRGETLRAFRAALVADLAESS
ncbi:MAG TPA: LysR family transcriptional regulator [Myxococcota bacterium]|nr:LysR family transcriptional regulator [Myxococcota bacterium]